MFLGSTQFTMETCTRNISWEVKAAGAFVWQPYYFHVPIVLKFGILKLLEPSGPAIGLYRICFVCSLCTVSLLRRLISCTFTDWCLLTGGQQRVIHKSPQREQLLPGRYFAVLLLKSVGKLKERTPVPVQAKQAYRGGRGYNRCTCLKRKCIEKVKLNVRL
jgi:hypothetical protein